MNESESITDKLGFPPKILEKLGAISIMCGKIEYVTEQIIWSLLAFRLYCHLAIS
jgi:hypothetical protein